MAKKMRYATTAMFAKQKSRDGGITPILKGRRFDIEETYRVHAEPGFSTPPKRKGMTLYDRSALDEYKAYLDKCWEFYNKLYKHIEEESSQETLMPTPNAIYDLSVDANNWIKVKEEGLIELKERNTELDQKRGA